MKPLYLPLFVLSVMCLLASPVARAAEGDAALLSDQRVEEKLAHDLYTALAEKWEIKQFQHIRKAEAQHGAQVLALLQSREAADPVADLPAGQVPSETAQALYDRLLKQGMESEVAALRAGAEVEEMDILHVRAALEQAEGDDVKELLGQFEQASTRHLQAFMRGLKQRGATYEPQHLSPEAFQAALDAEVHHGEGGEGGQHHGKASCDCGGVGQCGAAHGQGNGKHGEGRKGAGKHGGGKHGNGNHGGKGTCGDGCPAGHGKHE